MGRRDLLFFVLIGGGVSTLGVNLVPPSKPALVEKYDGTHFRDGDFSVAVDSINRIVHEEWQKENLVPAKPAAELQIARRLSLALMGTIPSLEEIRQFESLPPSESLNWWLDRILADRRYADFAAERIARTVVGTEDGPFLLFRRRRFVSWLGDELAGKRPYDVIVRELIAGIGLWTDHPATNFISVTSRPEEKNQPDPVRLAGRVTRAFLGLRLDCAQCHDHPFASWTQDQFEGFSAFFGQTHVGFTGIYDGDGEYELEHRKTKERRTVEPGVPFAAELLPTEGARREKLAAWVTHPKNPYFARATANRVWAMMFGRPLIAPVDNLETVGSPTGKASVLADKLLNAIANDFISHQFDLRRLIRVIAATEVFRLDSTYETELFDKAERNWAVFPISRLRPEQVVGGLIQAASVSTVDAASHIFTRLISFGQKNDFIKQYGDTGDDEFEERGGTIPQRLVMMNGDLLRERIKESPLNASTRIGMMAPTDPKAVEVAYLTVLSRRPTAEEAKHFEAFLGDLSLKRSQRLEDVYWTLLNATEFSWNH